MSTIVEARVPAEQFGLADTFDRVPGAEFRMIRTVAHGGDGAMPLLWGGADDVDRLVDSLERDDSTADLDVLASFDGECLFEVEWEAELEVLLYCVGEEDATVLDARGHDGDWHLKLFFPAHDSVSATYEFCREYGIDLTLERICDTADARLTGDVGLTSEQQQALSRAYEAGYYDVPRRINQAELAEGFDVSHQALSERLRRGHQTVVANALFQTVEREEVPVPGRSRTRIDG